MAAFSFENQGAETILLCRLEKEEHIDNMARRMLENNNIKGIFRPNLIQRDEEISFKFQVTSKVPVHEFYGSEMKRADVLRILSGVAGTLRDAKGYMLEDDHFMLDAWHIYVDVRTYAPSLLYLPVVEYKCDHNLRQFVLEFLSSIRYDMGEDVRFVAAIISFVNRARYLPAKALYTELRRIGEDLSLEDEERRAAPAASAPVPASAPAPVSFPAATAVSETAGGFGGAAAKDAPSVSVFQSDASGLGEIEDLSVADLSHADAAVSDIPATVMLSEEAADGEVEDLSIAALSDSAVAGASVSDIPATVMLSEELAPAYGEGESQDGGSGVAGENFAEYGAAGSGPYESPEEAVASAASDAGSGYGGMGDAGGAGGMEDASADGEVEDLSVAGISHADASVSDIPATVMLSEEPAPAYGEVEDLSIAGLSDSADADASVSDIPATVMLSEEAESGDSGSSVAGENFAEYGAAASRPYESQEEAVASAASDAGFGYGGMGEAAASAADLSVADIPATVMLSEEPAPAYGEGESENGGFGAGYGYGEMPAGAADPYAMPQYGAGEQPLTGQADPFAAAPFGETVPLDAAGMYSASPFGETVPAALDESERPTVYVPDDAAGTMLSQAGGIPSPEAGVPMQQGAGQPPFGMQEGFPGAGGAMGMPGQAQNPQPYGQVQGMPWGAYQQPAEQPQKKPGFFERLFGKKKKAEPAPGNQNPYGLGNAQGAYGSPNPYGATEPYGGANAYGNANAANPGWGNAGGQDAYGNANEGYNANAANWGNANGMNAYGSPNGASPDGNANEGYGYNANAQNAYNSPNPYGAAAPYGGANAYGNANAANPGWNGQGAYGNAASANPGWGNANGQDAYGSANAANWGNANGMNAFGSPNGGSPDGNASGGYGYNANAQNAYNSPNPYGGEDVLGGHANMPSGYGAAPAFPADGEGRSVYLGGGSNEDDEDNKTVIVGGDMEEDGPQAFMQDSSEAFSLRMATISRKRNGQSMMINKEVFRIGSAANMADFYIGDNPSISPLHADIVQTENGMYEIEDKNSPMHSFVNGEMVAAGARKRLQNGDVIRLGDEEFVFTVR